ncbi:accessory Sec system S-layer assembly protein [Fictibacillus phosphorivorans]|uniref:accessory Sec system S-layer assembly protein n=1 Tax=Fictibacillus phosphorivorans TaxID=1221500 RepID=UPI00203E12E6|nr:accessory Sec system S-layer assembly protein [Fictibacillus phosphorivorans]MCM3718493.1 accessory Sec system S-layer assembly protein [Fictibacillus phosphorivorans]MCM3776151.1 accessory Sec system S-layer assembly protein [Fictibacillus phosphorivorans]
MLSLFKKKNPNKTGEDTTVSSQELLNEQVEQSTEEEVETKLFYSPAYELEQELKYVYQFLNLELPPLKPNQISLSGVDLKQDGGVTVTAFIRNSLSKAIKLQEMPLLLLDAEGKKLARKVFDLSVVGEIPAKSSVPWLFSFEAADLFVEGELPKTGWKLAFELKAPKKHTLDLEESWANLPEQDKARLEQLVDDMAAPKPGEINFMGLNAKKSVDGNLHVTMLIRNGSDKNIQLQQLPLEVVDASGDMIARGGFALNDFEVKAYTSKPWTFIFPRSLVLKEEVDLSAWKAYPPQQNQ